MVAIMFRRNASSAVRVALPITRQLMAHRGLPLNEIDWPTSVSRSQRWTLPFAISPLLRRQYEAPGARLRLGRLLEDIDAFSADLAYAHCTDASPVGTTGGEVPTIVTACVDRVHLHGPTPLLKDGDVEYRGEVTWTGRTSLEVRVTCVQDGRELAHSWFVMVARDAQMKKGTAVPPQLEASARDLAEGEGRKVLRQERLERTLHRQPPSSEEIALVHDLFSQGGCAGLRMSSTCTQSTLLMHVEERNIHGKVFGGYLCRVSYELAWIAAHRLAKEMPVLRVIDDIAFLRPVEVNSVLSFDARVSYTDPTRGLMVVDVNATVQEDTGPGVVTTVFHYIFSVSRHVHLPAIAFETYQEAMHFLAGRRRLLSLGNLERVPPV